MASRSTKKALIALAHKRFKLAEAAESNQKKRELEAIEFYNGKQWPDAIIAARAGHTVNNNLPPVPARPTITINQTKEPVRQVLNQERSSDVGISLVPADDFGDDNRPINRDEIQLREDLVRRIQRDSEAADARTWAFTRAVIAGRGYYGVMTRYLPGKTTDQEIFIQRFYNQNSVMIDPAHEQPDGSDAEWGFVGADLSWEQYVAEYPKRANGQDNRLCDMSLSAFRAMGDEQPGWFTIEKELRFVRVVDYYYTVRESRELAMFEDAVAGPLGQVIIPAGTAQWVDELPEGINPKTYQTRRVVQPKIKWAKIDGCADDVLDETDWPGRWIPIVKVIGEELQPSDKERRCDGMVGPAMQLCQSANYMISKWVETVGLTPIPQWIMASGQDENFEDEWNGINTRTLGRVHYNNKDSEGVPIGVPQRVSAQADVGAIAGSIELFQQLLTKVMSTPDTSLGHADPSVKSGKLAKLLIDRGQMGMSNYMDNLMRSMRHEARMVNDLLYPIYQRPGRIARLVNANGDPSTVMLHQPFVMQGEPGAEQPQALPPGSAPPEGAKTLTLTPDADFNVAVKVSRNFDTRREQEVADLGELIAADPALMQVFGDLYFKYQDGPGHEEMSERMKVMLAPPVQAHLQGGQQPLPPQVQAQMAAMQQQLQQLQQLADKNRTDLMKTQMQEQGDTARSQAADQAGIEKATIAATASMANAQAKVDAENFRSYVDALETRLAKQLDLHMERLSTALTHGHEAASQAAEHTHQTGMAALQHAQALEQTQQAADLAPPPTNGASNAEGA